jgi:hypothetical protein
MHQKESGSKYSKYYAETMMRVCHIETQNGNARVENTHPLTTARVRFFGAAGWRNSKAVAFRRAVAGATALGRNDFAFAIGGEL